MTQYAGANQVERLVARVTVAFFDRYVLGQGSALAVMEREGNVTGTSALVSGGRLPPAGSRSLTPCRDESAGHPES